MTSIMTTERAALAEAGTVADAKTGVDSTAQAKATRQTKRKEKNRIYSLDVVEQLHSEVRCADFTGRLSDVLVAAIWLSAVRGTINDE